MSDGVDRLRALAREERLRASRSRDRAAVSACRSLLAALDNAEAIPLDPATDRAGALEQSAVGVGAADAARGILTTADAERLLADEIRERESVAATLTDTHGDHRTRLLDEAAVLHRLAAAWSAPTHDGDTP